MFGGGGLSSPLDRFPACHQTELLVQPSTLIRTHNRFLISLLLVLVPFVWHVSIPCVKPFGRPRIFLGIPHGFPIICKSLSNSGMWQRWLTLVRCGWIASFRHMAVRFLTHSGVWSHYFALFQSLVLVEVPAVE